MSLPCGESLVPEVPATTSKIKQIDDPDILNLLADGALQRSFRYDKELTPEAKAAADHFADEVEKLYVEARHIHRGDTPITLVILTNRKKN